MAVKMQVLPKTLYILGANISGFTVYKHDIWRKSQSVHFSWSSSVAGQSQQLQQLATSRFVLVGGSSLTGS